MSSSHSPLQEKAGCHIFIASNAKSVPGRTCRLLRQLADEDPPAFLCHFYNIYFAHTAGGRMIGTKVASMILDSRQLNFYKVSANC